MVDFAREIALKILYKIDIDKAYSNIILDEYLNNYRRKLNTKDIGLISEIVYGTTTWKLTIDTIIEKYSKVKLKKISNWVLNILRMGVYQILFLDKIPKSAAVNEGVNLAKKYAYKSVGFVNAVLRKIDKQDYEQLNKIENDNDRISKMYSIPQWLVTELLNEYSMQDVEDICKNSNEKPKITIRVNTLKTTIEELKKLFTEQKIIYEETEMTDFLHLLNVKNLGELDMFKKGLFSIQDIGAGKIGQMLNPKENEKILDICSAPGGKTTHIAELMKNKGEIIACDIYKHRIKLVEENADRLGINIIKTQINDALVYNEDFINKFDKILLDVPCLGIGVMKRKPDIKWQRKKEDIQEIAKIQYNILEQCSKYLKKNGEMVYSTCSILKNENEYIIEKFLKNAEKNQKESKYILKDKEKILPAQNTDGFFMVKIKKM